MGKIGYVRVSDGEQEEALQRDALAAAGCARIIADHGASGAVPNRRGLATAMRALKEGDALVVWKLDRLGRSNLHLADLLVKLRERGVRFVSLTQGIDTEDSAGRMVFGLLAVIAEFERDQISERTRAGMAAAKLRGRHLGRLSNAAIRAVHARFMAGQDSLASLARKAGVSELVLRRGFKRLRLATSGGERSAPVSSVAGPS